MFHSARCQRNKLYIEMMRIFRMNSMVILVWCCIFLANRLSHANKIQEKLCVGHWETLQSIEQQSYHIKAGRTPKQANNSALGYTPWDQPWFWEACPTQTTLHSCHFHGNKSHAEALERRVWVTSDPSCLEFAPMEFLELIRDRRLILIGDSLLTQLWQVLICALQGTAEQRLYVHWAKMWRCNEVTCPHDEAKHSNCYGGIARFPTANVTIINKKMYKYTKDYFLGTLRRLKVSSRDVILVNFGLHYNDEKEYNRAIESFNTDLQQESTVDNNLQRLKIAFFETSPQHYPAPNGYFVHGEENGNECRPMRLTPTDNSMLAPGDWRNRIIHRIFTPPSTSAASSSLSIQIIPLAHGLYSQHDAHVAREPYPSPPWLDCTHWCFPSGALRYFILHLYNGVRQLVGKQHAHYHNDAFAHSHSVNHDSARKNPSNNHHSNDLALIQALGYPDGSLLKGSGRSIYLIKGQKRCEFGSFDAFQKLGLDLSKVVKIPDDELDEIPLGSTIY